MLKLAIFDLDGTLLNTIADLANAVNHTLEAHGLPQHSLDEYPRFVGRGMRNLVKDALPESQREDGFVDAFLQEFLAWYIGHIDICTRPYDGMTGLVSELHAAGVKLAVASNKVQRGTEQLVAKFFPGIPFVAVCGNGPDFPLKPDAALVRHIMSLADVTPDETVMIGDSNIDIQTAHNAGIPVVAVTWGFCPESALQDADQLASDIDDLATKLQSQISI